MSHHSLARRALAQRLGFKPLEGVVQRQGGADGISLQASLQFQNQRRRELIEWQIPENPTDRLQLFGRVNRYEALAQSYKDISKTVLGDKFEQHSKELFAQLTKVTEGFRVDDKQSQAQSALSQYVRSMVGSSDDKPGQIPQIPRERMAS
jgi:hypothetical protein